MDVLFEGRLNPELHLKTVLQRVLENKPQGNLLIRISSPYASSNGRLLIRDGRYITAALLDDSDESGYAALRSLLAVTMGNFSGLRPSQDEKIDLVPNLNIELHKVIPLMPTLPESPIGLFDEKSLLDKVFSTNNSFEKLGEMQPEQAMVEPLQPQMPVQPQNPPLSQMSAPAQMSGQPLPGQPQLPQLPQFPLSPSQSEIPAWQKDRTVQISKAIIAESEQTGQIRRPAEGNVRRPADPTGNIRRGGDATGNVRRPVEPTGNIRRPAEPTGNMPTVPDGTGRSEQTGRQPVTDNLLDANRDVRRPPPMTSIYEGLDDIQVGSRNGPAQATATAQYAKSPTARSASPILIIILVSFLLVAELLAMVFWKPLNTYLLTKNIHLPGVEIVHKKPAKRAAGTQKHRS